MASNHYVAMWATNISAFSRIIPQQLLILMLWGVLNLTTVMTWPSKFGIGVHREISGSVPPIPGNKNVEADRESRNTNDDREWSLSTTVYNNLLETWGPFQIDLFASRLNFKVPNYASWRPDPGAKFIYAFSFNWDPYYFYAFPPFSLIALCLQKVEEDRSTGVLLVPLWPTQPWFPVLLRSLIDHPRILPNSKHLLTQAHSKTPHPLGKKLKLLACLVSGKASSKETFQTQLPQLLCSHGQQAPRSSTNHISHSGSTFVVDGKVIHMNPCRYFARLFGHFT